MDALLARYIEGDLDADEASAFLDALERSPRLEAELRAYEAVLSQARRPAALDLDEDFTDRVMVEALTDRPRARTIPSRRQPALWWLAAAAAVVAMFGAGWFTSRQSTSLSPLPATFVAPAAWTMPLPAVDGVRLVRLVYQPAGADVAQVTVAGSFNGWDPASVPLTFDGRVWSAVLALPPGSYEYMFVEDGTRWVTDPLAPRARSDGFGGENAVLDITA